MLPMSQNKKILLIEDDPFAAEWVERIVKKRFVSGVEIDRITSEREFLLRLPQLSKENYAAIILDLILPWEDGVSLDTSEEHLEPRGDVYEAGIRIFADLKHSNKFRTIPIVIYSINDEDRIAWPEKLEKPQFINKQAPDFRLLEWLSGSLGSS